MMKKQLVLLFVIMTICITAGCSMFVSAPKEITKGDKVVCILYKPGDFKADLADKIAVELAVRDYTVITDNVKRAKFYKASDFAAVIYMAEYGAWHTPFHTKKYYDRNNKADNILFVVTAGDPDVEIDKPFDAVTCTSKKSERQKVYEEVMEQLDVILK